MSNYKLHALREFRAAGWTDENGGFNDDYQEAICNHVLKLLDVFSEEGHSGSSAHYAISLFSKLASFGAVTPLTGEDWEWHEVGPGTFQNIRCSHVFKSADRFNGQAYDIDGRIFFDWYTDKETGERRKSHFTSFDSAVPVTFPYTPTREYVERKEQEHE